jgi:hypothetical protein
MTRKHPDQAHRIQVIRTGAAAISQLLADGTLQDEDFDRAAQVLISFRRSRNALERALAGEEASLVGRRGHLPPR